MIGRFIERFVFQPIITLARLRMDRVKVCTTNSFTAQTSPEETEPGVGNCRKQPSLSDREDGKALKCM